MANGNKRNHYPDWIFYFLVIIAVLSIFGTYKYYNQSSLLDHELKLKVDSLSFERNEVAKLNSIFDSQTQLTIRNSGTIDFAVNRFYVFYFDKKEGKFKSCIGHIEGSIKANGGECKPRIFDGDVEVWNGNALAYYIEVVSIGNYIKDNSLPFCKSGSIVKGETITINADAKSNILDMPATCN